MLVDGGAHRPAHRFRHRVGIAPPRPRQALHRRYHDVEHDLVDDLAGRILLGDADQINLGIVGQFALFGHRDRDEGAAGKRHPAPLDHGARFGILQDRAVLVEPSRRQFLDDAGIAGPELDQIAVAADQDLGHARGPRQLGVLEQMQRLAVHGDQELRTHPGNHVAQFVAARMAGDVDEMGAVGDDLDALRRPGR